MAMASTSMDVEAKSDLLSVIVLGMAGSGKSTFVQVCDLLVSVVSPGPSFGT